MSPTDVHTSYKGIGRDAAMRLLDQSSYPGPKIEYIEVYQSDDWTKNGQVVLQDIKHETGTLAQDGFPS